MKGNYVWLIRGLKKTDKSKITFKSGMNESEIDFVLVSKKDRKHLRDVSNWELQQRLAVADVDEKELRKLCEKESKIRRMTWKLQDKEVQEKF